MSGRRHRAAARRLLTRACISTHKLLGDVRLWDDNKRRTYVKLADAMRRAKDDAWIIDDAPAFVRRFKLPDPHQRAYGERWMQVLDLPVDPRKSPGDIAEIARLLLADTPEADLLCDTAPVFGRGLSVQETYDLLFDPDAGA